MEEDKKKKVRLGIFVTIGLIIFVGVIYYMGTDRGLFGERIEVSAIFKSVEGLKEGNNVRFSGIKVGVVKEVRIISDTTVKVIMNVEEEAAQFMKEDSYATIESEGLMGNKMVSISQGGEAAPVIEPGTIIPSREPIGMEDVLQRIAKTANEANRLTENLADISERIKSGKGALGKMIYDTTLMNRVNRSLTLIEASSRDVRQFTTEINEMAENLNEGDGLATKLIYDEEWAHDVGATLDSLHKTSTMMTKAGRDMKIFMDKLNSEKGAIQKLLNDSTMAKDLHQTIINIKKGTQDLDEAINTVDNSWILNLFGGNKD
ncbi:MAG: MlaD family protein [Candidatus Cyclobacteriaceae bacterium M2_1C_046]